MKIKDVINKCEVGVSPLTGKLYIYYPDKDGSAKYKKEITKDTKHTKKVIAFWLNKL